MSSKTAKRRKKVKREKAKRRRQRKEILAVVEYVASKIDEQYGLEWRSDPLIVAKFERVVAEEIEATKHRGIVVMKGSADAQMKRLSSKVFGAPDPRLVSPRPVD